MKKAILLLLITIVSFFNLEAQNLPSPAISYPDDCEPFSDFPIIIESDLNQSNGYYGRMLAGIGDNYNSVNQVISSTMDDDSNIYLVGETNGAVGNGLVIPSDIPSYLIKLNQCGKRVWFKSFNEIVDGEDITLSVYDVQYNNENIFVLTRGYNFDYTETNQTTFLHKLDLNGNEVSRSKFPYLIHTTLEIDKETNDIFISGKMNKYKLRLEFPNSSEIIVNDQFEENSSYLFLRMDSDLSFSNWFDSINFNTYEVSYPIVNFKDSQFMNLAYSENNKKLYFQGNNLNLAEWNSTSGYAGSTIQTNNYVGYFSIDNNTTVSINLKHPFDSSEHLIDIDFSESSNRLYTSGENIVSCDQYLNFPQLIYNLGGKTSSFHLLQEDNQLNITSVKNNSLDDHVITIFNLDNNAIYLERISAGFTDSQYTNIYSNGNFVVANGFFRNSTSVSYEFNPNMNNSSSNIYPLTYNSGSSTLINRLWNRRDFVYARNLNPGITITKMSGEKYFFSNVKFHKNMKIYDLTGKAVKFNWNSKNELILNEYLSSEIIILREFRNEKENNLTTKIILN